MSPDVSYSPKVKKRGLDEFWGICPSSPAQPIASRFQRGVLQRRNRSPREKKLVNSSSGYSSPYMIKQVEGVDDDERRRFYPSGSVGFESSTDHDPNVSHDEVHRCLEPRRSYGLFWAESTVKLDHFSSSDKEAGEAERDQTMAHLVRPLRLWPRFHHGHHHHRCRYLLPYPSSLSPFGTASHHHHRHPLRRGLFPTLVPSSRRDVHYRPRGLRFPNSAPAYDPREGDGSDSDSDSEKSRNQKKREARRAVRWGMELASFSNPQIKRILRVASLEKEVLDALMIAKRLGPDVREGKRRQFNYIGKLLREVEPELMDALIEATKDGDHSRLQALSVLEACVGEDDDEGEEDFEEEDEEEEEEYSEHASIASRWFDGLISKDIQITNEVYSIPTIDFDRQELRKLVRNVQSIQGQPAATNENEREASIALLRAQKSLTGFLRNLARQFHGSTI